MRRVGVVVRELLRPVVVEQAILHAAVLGPQSLAIVCRHADALDSSLPDVVDDAVVNRQPLHIMIGVDLEAVPLDVLDCEVGDRHACTGPHSNQLAVPAPRAVKHYPLAAAGLAAQRHIVGSQLEVARHLVEPVRQQDGAARPHVVGRREQLLHIRDVDDCVQ